MSSAFPWTEGVEVKKTRRNRRQGQTLSDLVKEHSVKHLEILSGALGWGHLWVSRNRVSPRSSWKNRRISEREHNYRSKRPGF